jgi:hypothetical protein
MSDVLDSLFTEISRSPKLLHKNVMLSDGVLGYDGDPNAVVNGRTTGESLIYNSTAGTGYLQENVTPFVMWTKVESGAGGLWLQGGGKTEIAHGVINDDDIVTYLLFTGTANADDFYGLWLCVINSNISVGQETLVLREGDIYERVQNATGLSALVKKYSLADAPSIFELQMTIVARANITNIGVTNYDDGYPDGVYLKNDSTFFPAGVTNLPKWIIKPTLTLNINVASLSAFDSIYSVSESSRRYTATQTPYYANVQVLLDSGDLAAGATYELDFTSLIEAGTVSIDDTVYIWGQQQTVIDGQIRTSEWSEPVNYIVLEPIIIQYQPNLNIHDHYERDTINDLNWLTLNALYEGCSRSDDNQLKILESATIKINLELQFAVDVGAEGYLYAVEIILKKNGTAIHNQILGSFAANTYYRFGTITHNSAVSVNDIITCTIRHFGNYAYSSLSLFVLNNSYIETLA